MGPVKMGPKHDTPTSKIEREHHRASATRHQAAGCTRVKPINWHISVFTDKEAEAKIYIITKSH